ncbi:hypothetical protein NBRC116589_33770 [Ruegeria sp. HU-ET01832]|uniref:response regulator n=1 Tax=Ruegeria sp. HU-ET01832 TaxID=3135906 RepID=UPI00310B0FC0
MKHTTPTSDEFQRKLDMRALKRTPLKVLAVDDEPGILELLQTALAEFESCQVSVASSASQALQVIKEAETPFDCLLLDIQMPGTNGIELLRQIRNTPGNSETPAIMLTAMSDRKHVEDAFAEGAFDYVTKPFDFFELRSRMNAAHLLMQERVRSRISSVSVKNLQNVLDYNQQFSFEDPLSVDGLKRCLRYVEFDNYIEQLGRSRLFDSWVTAIRLQDAAFRFDLNDFGEFRRIIADLGKSIQTGTAEAEAIFSYRGSGIYLVVTHGRYCAAKLPSEDQLNQNFAQILAQRNVSGDIRTVMSTPISMRALSKSGALAAFDKAVAKLELREKGAPAGQQATQEQTPYSSNKTKPRGSLFETVLREMYGSQTYLNRG